MFEEEYNCWEGEQRKEGDGEGGGGEEEKGEKKGEGGVEKGVA